MMNHQIYFTPQDIVEIIKSVCYLITVIAGAGGVIAYLVSKAKAPDKSRDETLKDHENRIVTCEGEITEIKKDIEDSEREFERMDRSDRVFQRGLLALINHSLDGNNVDEMETVRDELRADIFGSSGISEKTN